MLLALSAYNCGEGCGDAAVRRAQAQGLSGQLPDLQLNPETTHYVPRLLALARVVAQAVDAGDLASTHLPPLANAPYLAAVPIARDVDVALASQLAGLSVAEFRALNPQHQKPVIVAATNAEVLVPVERAPRLQAALLNHAGPLASWSTQRVLRRSSVEALARQYGSTPQRLREVNAIAPGREVAAGSTLLVPRPATAPDISAAQAQTARVSTVPAWVTHTVQVQRRDTWANLAERLGVNAAQLRRWNPQAQASLRRGPLVLRLPIEVAERLAGRGSRVAAR